MMRPHCPAIMLPSKFSYAFRRVSWADLWPPYPSGAESGRTVAHLLPEFHTWKFSLSARKGASGSKEEVKQAEELLGRWAPIDTADALKLLGREREFANEVVRRFAVR